MAPLPPTEPIEFIRSANMPQLGSFGEAVYEQFMTESGADISRLHVGRADFEVNGVRVDVKTSRHQLGKHLQKPVFNYRHEVLGTHYAILEFHQLGALLSMNKEIIARFDWTFLNSVFEKWREGGFGKAHNIQRRTKKSLCPVMIERTKRAFVEAGLPEPYMLQRTVMFDNESPHNLLPSQRKPTKQTGATVFFVFHQAPPIQENLKEVIAFPDTADSCLVRLKKLRTASHIENLEKADIDLIPPKYRFDSIESLQIALRENWH
jgi:6-pyruvoyl-tetrahydropterin synthase